MSNKKWIGLAAGAVLAIGTAVYVAGEKCPPGQARRGLCVIAPPAPPPADTVVTPPHDTTTPGDPHTPPGDPIVLLPVDSAVVPGVTPLDTAKVAKVIVLSSRDTVYWGELVSFRAVVLDARGDTLRRKKVEWSVDNNIFEYFKATDPLQYNVLAKIRDVPLNATHHSLFQSKDRRIAMVFSADATIR